MEQLTQPRNLPSSTQVKISAKKDER